MNDRALALIDLFRDLQETVTRADLIQCLLTRAGRIVSFDWAVRWSLDPEKLGSTLCFHETSDGTSMPSEDTPFSNALRASMTPLLHDPSLRVGTALLIPIHDLPDYAHGMLTRLNTDDDTEPNEGILFLRRQAFDPGADTVMGDITLLGSTVLKAIRHSANNRKAQGAGDKKTRAFLTRSRLIIAGLILFCCPFPLTISAPAELVADASERITAPFDGVIKKIHVNPGDPVRAGDLLVDFDDDVIRSRRDLAAEELAAARATLPRLMREALLTPEKKNDIARVRATIAMKEVEMAYHDRQLRQTALTANGDGIAIFGDRSDTTGQRVHAGDILITIGAKHSQQVLVRVPAARLVPVDTTHRARVYWDSSPLFAAPLTLTQIGYQATPDPDGLLSYKFRGTLKETDPNTRVGWRGTAHIDAGWSTLGYIILRRPLSWLRLHIGF